MEEENTDPGSVSARALGVSATAAEQLIAFVREMDESWDGQGDLREVAWRLAALADKVLRNAGRPAGLPEQDWEDARAEAGISLVSQLLQAGVLESTEPVNFRALFMTIARRKAIDIGRRRTTARRLDDVVADHVPPPPNVDDLVEARRTLEVVEEIVAKLDPERGEALRRLARGDEKEEIYRAFGWSRQTGRTNLNAALVFLMFEARARGLVPLLVLVALGLSASRGSLVSAPSRPDRPGRLLLTALMAAVPGRFMIAASCVVATLAVKVDAASLWHDFHSKE